MTDEVKAALDSWRSQAYGDKRCCNVRSADAGTLADAFAALYQPDDDEPVTVEELRNLTKETEYLHGGDFGGTLYLATREATIVNPTRGQLRRLIGALES